MPAVFGAGVVTELKSEEGLSLKPGSLALMCLLRYGPELIGPGSWRAETFQLGQTDSSPEERDRSGRVIADALKTSASISLITKSDSYVSSK